MPDKSYIQIMKHGPLAWLLFALLILLAFGGVTQAQTIDGFTQPFRSIELSSDESGAVQEMPVREGDKISKDEVVARLDDRIQQLQLELAEHQLKSHSELDAARRSFKKREVIGERIKDLRKEGHASESEIIRSEMELSIAKAKYMASQEAAVAREIEYRRAKTMVERRTVRAPFGGVVATVHRDIGEYVSPMRPDIITLVQTDTLLAVFNVPVSNNYLFEKNKPIDVKFVDGRVASGTVHSIGVVVDAESGTVPVKIKIDNKEGLFKSGEQCQLEL